MRRELLDDVTYLSALVLETLDGEPEGTDAQAVAIAAELAATADRALHQVVRDARGNDVSWAEVGEVLGISRQAAQKRFDASPPKRVTSPAPPPTQHFVDEATAILDAAAALDHSYIDARLAKRLRRQLGDEGIGPHLRTVESVYGAFISRGPVVARPVSHAVTVVAREHREKADAEAQLVLTPAGELLGIYYVEADGTERELPAEG